MAIPVIRALTENTATATNSITMTKPTGAVSGDLLVMNIGSMVDNPTSEFPSSITGWTTQWNAGTSGIDSRTQNVCYTRIADGTEGASESVSISSNVDLAGTYVAIQNVDNASPVNVIGTESSNNNTFLTTLSVTTTQDDCLILSFDVMYRGGGNPFTTVETNWAMDASFQTGTGQSNIGFALASRDLATTGASGEMSIDASVSQRQTGRQFAIAGSLVDNTSATIMMGAPF